MSRLSRLFTQLVTLETFLGAGARGDVYAAPVAVPCFIQDVTKLTRKQNAEEVVSTTTLFADISTSPDSPPVAGQFAGNSRVTVNGRQAFVITTGRQNSGGPARIHHTRVDLT